MGEIFEISDKKINIYPFINVSISAILYYIGRWGNFGSVVKIEYLTLILSYMVDSNIKLLFNQIPISPKLNFSFISIFLTVKNNLKPFSTDSFFVVFKSVHGVSTQMKNFLYFFIHYIFRTPGNIAISFIFLKNNYSNF